MGHDDFYKSLLDNTYEGIYFVDINRKISFWNKAAELITGYSADDVVEKYCYNNILDHVDHEGNHLCVDGCPLHKTIDDGETREAEVYLRHKAGHRIPVSIRAISIKENGRVIGAVELFVDITQRQEEKKKTEEYKSLALYDQLTGLPNRRYIESFLESKLNEYISFQIPFGVLFVDVDNFKNCNDTYGHEAGDEVLKMVAAKCSGLTRSTDFFGRLGGDEFVAVLTGTNRENMGMVAESMRKLAENFIFLDNDLHINISIGATLVNSDDSVASVLKRADSLLYQSKQGGRNRVTYG
ncbi:MAG: sensor domain-containing diguanylate cyclase [Eubacteriales bacterium]